jgi:AraC-like DNA-binding protein
MEAEDAHEDGHETPAVFPIKARTPSFYKKFRKQLRSHIPSMQNIEKQTLRRHDHAALFIRKVNSIILSQLENEHFDTACLARSLAMSRSQLYRKLKPLIRQSPGTYIRYIRLEKAKELLIVTTMPVGDIGLKVGFPDPSHFGRAFKNQYGFTPTQMRGNQDLITASSIPATKHHDQ